MTLMQIAKQIAAADVLAVCDLSQLAAKAAGYDPEQVAEWALDAHNSGTVTLMRDPAPHLRSASERAAWVHVDGLSFSAVTFEQTTHGQENAPAPDSGRWARNDWEECR